MPAKKTIISIPRTVALCYIRQSMTRDASDTNSPERQKANILVICQKNNWTPEWYQDADGHKSGRTEKNRPEWLALKARLSDPDVVALVANDTSRLHRKSWRIGDLLDFLQEHQIRLVLASSNQEIDLTGVSGLIFAQLAAIFDEWYAADISRRQKDNVAYRKSLGKVAGLPPFGTQRRKDGYLQPSTEGGWWLPDGRFVSGEPATAPDEGALWRSYYDCAFYALTLYAENKHGWEEIAYQLNIEGWPFRTRDAEPRPINKDDVRRIVRNWPEYGGLVLDVTAKKRRPREQNLDKIQLIPERAVFPLELLYTVAKVHIERSEEPKDRGSHQDSRTYALAGLSYCAHCEQRALQQNNPKLRSRLIGRRGRYAHKEGILCGCANRSAPGEGYEGDVGRLVKLLTVRSDALGLMTELAIQVGRAPHAPDEEIDAEAEKQEAIALCTRRIDAAINLYGDGRISREEYLRRVAFNEREIAHWEARTTETEKAALELTMCMDAIDKLSRLWDISDPEDRQGMARSIFSYIVYDLDERRITDFRLKPWADHFLVLRAALYQDENPAIAEEIEPVLSMEPHARDMPPKGLEANHPLRRVA